MRRTDPPDGEQTTVSELVARACREVRRDQRLRAQASDQELVLLAEDAVRSLWHDSRVKTFIGVLAMRRVREELGTAEEHGRTEPPMTP